MSARNGGVPIFLLAKHGLFLHQVDVVGTFLNGDIEEDIDMRQPDGLVAQPKETTLWKLKKALYLLKQAGMIWKPATR
jgi:hypothetical protein